jgi:ankyrin repeat protein
LLKDVIYLIELGSSPNQKDAKNDKFLLHIAARKGHSDIVKYLIERGADVNAKDYFQRTALHLASRLRQFEIIQFLIENGADVNAKDKFEETALQIAIQQKHFDTVKYLIEIGADANANANSHFLGEYLNW